MSTMRQLINNIKLHSILNTIENTLGYQINAEAMPEENEKFAAGSINYNLNLQQWIFLYKASNKFDQTTICHELMHLVLLFEGWPLIFNKSNPEIFYYYTTKLLIELPHHIEVWNLVNKLGFEQNNFNYVLDKTIYDISTFHFHSYTDCIPETANIVQSLLCPANTSKKLLLRNIAEIHLPEALRSADIIIQIINEYSPDFPKSSVDAVFSILKFLNIDYQYIDVKHFDIINPNYRQFILK
jgi:hypothetical protein